MAETTENKAGKLAKNKKYILVRYGRMDLMGWFSHEESTLPRVHTRVIIKTDRGLEMGEIVGPHCYKAGQFRLNEEQAEKYYRDSGAELPIIESVGEFQRFATTQDIHEEQKLAESAKEELEACRKVAKEMNLDMKVVGSEHLFGGERIIFYFIADGRVDFRDLVKRLAREYQTRIEMRQIGSRDEAKLVGDYEACGLECCCKRFLKILKPVNMRMAKLQKATLDPSKISGHCGRLKCCLRYEDDTYRALRDRLPKKNTRVKTAHGEGRVVDTQILTQLVIVQDDQGAEFAVPFEEITIIGEPSHNSNNDRSNDRQPRPRSEANQQESSEHTSDVESSGNMHESLESEPVSDQDFIKDTEPTEELNEQPAPPPEHDQDQDNGDQAKPA
jgi:cell fate regulator YaaT (PSP1 superfamily)